MNLFTGACPDDGFPALDVLPWRDEPQTALRAARLVLEAAELPEELVSWLAGRPTGQLERILERSLERTTHVKWFLGARSGEYVVWLHEYKPPEVFARAVGFAASVHNHRYGFCSRVLAGALHVSAFAAPTAPDERLRLIQRSEVKQGQVMSLSHEDIHQIDQVEPYTYTILVQGPVARNFSTCYDTASGNGRRVYDLQSRLPHTLTLLTDQCRGGLTVG
jgi:hypothetical protein